MFDTEKPFHISVNMRNGGVVTFDLAKEEVFLEYIKGLRCAIFEGNSFVSFTPPGNMVAVNGREIITFTATYPREYATHEWLKLL